MKRTAKKTPKVSIPEDIAKKLGLDFETALYEAIVISEPDNIDALFNLGDAYTRRGLYDRGLEIDKRLVKLLPENEVVHYNLACSYSLMNEVDLAFDSLEKAMDLGYLEFEFMESDPDLANVRKDRRFEAIMAKYMNEV